MSKWYKNLYRRNLVDMHIADWDEKFLSELDIDKYVDNLKRAKIQSPMIYLQAHTGICNFPTKSAKMHNAFKSDPYKMKRLIEKCKENGMRPVGYYSLIFNNWAEDNYPSWAMRDYNGQSKRERDKWRYGLCCPNNEEYRQFLEAQIKEMSEIFDLDAIFYDMPYWEMLCQCDSCKKKWKELYSVDMPIKEDWNDSNWLNYERMRQVWMGEFVKFVEGVTKKYMPDTTVEFNYSAVIGSTWLGASTELINEGCEYASGDLYGDLYSQSFACKYYSAVTKNQPFEYMTSVCDPNLFEHTVIKEENSLTSQVLLTAAHHGASLMIDAIDPLGTLDQRVYDRLGKVFEKQIPYEKYFTGDYLWDIGVFFDSTTQYNSCGLEMNNKWAAVNAVKKLVKNHIATNVIANTTCNDLSRNKIIIAPMLEDFDNDNIPKFIEYVKNGGKLIITSKSESRLMKEFFGGTFKGLTPEGMTYMRPTAEGKKYFPDFLDDYPAPVKNQAPVYEFSKNVKVLAKITLPVIDKNDISKFVSIHSNPPVIKSDIPAMVKADYGKGQVIWICSAIENDDRLSFERIFMSCIDDLYCGDKTFTFDGSRDIEVTAFKDKGRYIIHLFDYHTSEALQRNYKLSVKVDFPVTKVYDGGSMKDIYFDYKDNVVTFSGTFTTFAGIIIE